MTRTGRSGMSWGGVVLLLVSVAGAQERLETLDARAIDGRLIRLDAERAVLLEGKTRRDLPRADVAEIALAPAGDPMARRGRGVIVTAAGDVLSVTALTLADGRLAAGNDLLGPVALKLSAAAAVYLPASGQTAAAVRRRVRALKLPDATKDALIVERDKKPWTVAAGVLVAMGPKKITFRWKDASRTIERGTVRAVRLARVGKAQPRGTGILIGRDGDRVAFSSVAIDEKTVTVVSLGFGERKIPRGRVAAIRLHSDRVVSLSDLQPAAVKEVPFFDTKFPHRVDRSAGGRALRLGGRTFERGLGLHSFCELTYDLGGAYKTFVAAAGIDDAVRPAGDATLTFLGDGKPLAKPFRLTGRTEPIRIRLSLVGVKRFTVRVDYGKDKIDAADHVDLAAPRLIK